MKMSKNIFEKASRLGLRFKSEVGDLTVENLWNLPLSSPKQNTDIQRVARIVKRELDDVEYDITGLQTNVQSENSLRLEILEHIVSVRQSEIKQREISIANSQKLAKLDEIIASKADNELTQKSIEELMAMRDELI